MAGRVTAVRWARHIIYRAASPVMGYLFIYKCMSPAHHCSHCSQLSSFLQQVTQLFVCWACWCWCSAATISDFFRRLKSFAASRRALCAPVTFPASMSFLNSSTSLFSFARRFWNLQKEKKDSVNFELKIGFVVTYQVITWALVRPKDCAISSRSAGERYFWYRKRFSSSKIWWLVKAVRDFLFFLIWDARLLNKLRWSVAASVGKTEENTVSETDWKSSTNQFCQSKLSPC